MLAASSPDAGVGSVARRVTLTVTITQSRNLQQPGDDSSAPTVAPPGASGSSQQASSKKPTNSTSSTPPSTSMCMTATVSWPPALRAEECRSGPSSCVVQECARWEPAFCASVVRDADETLLEALLNDPVRITLSECEMPLEGSSCVGGATAQPQVVSVLGVALVPLSALVTEQQATVVSGWQTLSGFPEGAEPPQVEVCVRASEPLLSESDRRRANWLTLVAGPLRSLPPSCTGHNARMFFDFGLWFDLSASNDPAAAPALVPGGSAPGEMRACLDRGTLRKVAQAAPGQGAAGCAVVTGSDAPAAAPGSETKEGEGEGAGEGEAPVASEVDWGFSRKYYLSPKLTESWKKGIETGSLGPLMFELRRRIAADFKDRVPDACPDLYRGSASVDLRPLLEPGRSELEGTFLVVHSALAEDPLWTLEKAAERASTTSLQSSQTGADPATSGASGAKERRGRARSKSRGEADNADHHHRKKSPVPPAPDAEGSVAIAAGSAPAEASSGTVTAVAAEKKPVRRAAPKQTPSTVASGKQTKLVKQLEKVLKAEEGASHAPYEDAKTTLRVSISLAKSLVPLPPPPRPRLRAVDFLPKRKLLPRHQQLREATAEYRHEIQRIVDELASEYGQLFGEGSDPAATQELSRLCEGDRQKMFSYRLNSSSAYYRIKESLKKAVVRIVREKFAKTSASQVPQQELVASFMNQLYVYLVDQFHAALNRKTSTASLGQGTISVAKSEADCHSASEYEWVGSASTAARFHHRRIVADRSAPEPWYDYALFCFRTGDEAKGEEALTEALSVSESMHSPSLTALAMRAFGAGESGLSRSAAFLDEAMRIDPQNRTARLALAIVLSEESPDPTRSEDKFEVEDYVRASSFSLEVRAARMAGKILARAVTEQGNRWEWVAALARLHVLQCNLRWAEDFSQRALDMSQSPAVRTLVGDVFALRLNREEAIVNYKKAVELYEAEQGQGGNSEDFVKALVRLGRIQQESGHHEEAKEAFLRACKHRPGSSALWLAVGKTCFRLGQLEEAEKSLAEANTLSIDSGEVWAFLCMTCLKLGRDVEADEAFENAMTSITRDPVSSVSQLLAELATLQMEHGNLVLAEKALRHLMGSAPDDPQVVSLLADCLARESETEEALALYDKVSKDAAASQQLREHAQHRMGELKK